MGGFTSCAQPNAYWEFGDSTTVFKPESCNFLPKQKYSEHWTMGEEFSNPFNHGRFFFLPSRLKFASGPNLCLVGMICYLLLSQRTASQHLDLNEKAVHLSWQSKHHSLLPPKTASPALCHSACKAKGQSGNTYCYSACYFPLCKDVSSYTHRGAYNCQKRN